MNFSLHDEFFIVEERVASAAGYRSFSANRERHTDVRTGTDPSELHYEVLNTIIIRIMLEKCILGFLL